MTSPKKMLFLESSVIPTEMKSNRNQMLFRHGCGTRPRRIELNQLNDGNTTNVNKQQHSKNKIILRFEKKKKLKMAQGGKVNALQIHV